MPHPIVLPGDSGYLEMPETDDGYTSALNCRRPDGSEWQALPPDGDRDAWVTVSLEGCNTVVANLWSGWRVHLDPATGNETARHFTK